jgi:hypothetical protein
VSNRNYCLSKKEYLTSSTAIPVPTEASVEVLTDDDLLLLAKFIYLLQEEMVEEEAVMVESLLQREDNRRQRKKRIRKVIKRRGFKDIIHADFSDKQFRRMFRMSLESFDKLCVKICDTVGEKEFKPESTLISQNNPSSTTTAIGEDPTTKRKGLGAIDSSGGPLSGEVRVAIFLRILSGASYLDLMVIFEVTHDPIFRSFKLVCNWIRGTFKFPLVNALRNEDTEYFDNISSTFSHVGASCGNYSGCIGAIDGIAMRIKRPTLSNKLRDPGAYYCRKGFYSLNCQAICDCDKRILWISSKHIGSTHDAAAFHETKLYRLLQQKKEYLKKHGFFIAGDSAYCMDSFLLTPYSTPGPRSAEDAYNFYHSNCRIRIECTFGEIVMRFGIFWRTLNFDLSFNGDIIEAAALLHNYIVDQRDPVEAASFQNFSCQTLAEESPIRSSVNFADIPSATITDNNEPRPVGRPTTSEISARDQGALRRETIKISLQVAGLRRPLYPGHKYNSYGMIYMEY